MQAPLVDQHPAEEAVVFQRVGDIPSRSPDQLVLVDIAFENAQSRRSTHQRQIHLLPRFLCRLGMIQSLQLEEQCAQPGQEQRCLIFFNNAFWEPDDIGGSHMEFTFALWFNLAFLQSQGVLRSMTLRVIRLIDCPKQGSNPMGHLQVM